jgi:hypothetical protein
VFKKLGGGGEKQGRLCGRSGRAEAGRREEDGRTVKKRRSSHSQKGQEAGEEQEEQRKTRAIPFFEVLPPQHSAARLRAQTDEQPKATARRGDTAVLVKMWGNVARLLTVHPSTNTFSLPKNKQTFVVAVVVVVVVDRVKKAQCLARQKAHKQTRSLPSLSSTKYPRRRWAKKEAQWRSKCIHTHSQKQEFEKGPAGRRRKEVVDKPHERQGVGMVVEVVGSIGGRGISQTHTWK